MKRDESGSGNESLLVYLRIRYATSHEDLDADENTFVEMRNAALSLGNIVKQIHTGAYQAPQAGLHSPREK